MLAAGAYVLSPTAFVFLLVSVAPPQDASVLPRRASVLPPGALFFAASASGLVPSARVFALALPPRIFTPFALICRVGMRRLLAVGSYVVFTLLAAPWGWVTLPP